ncbi:MAG: ribonuclease inhibitor [Ferruginibacter sp.]|nr:ribonuclease inhibitor [Cytophagales bacterium]
MTFRKVRFPLLAFLLVWSSELLAQTAGPGAEAPSDWLIFLGRFHPLLVHLPIGFLLVAFLMEVFSRFRRYEGLQPATSFVLLLGAVSAVATTVLGYFLSLGGGYDEDTLFWHQWLGIGVAVAAVLAYALKAKLLPRLGSFNTRVYLPVFSVAILALMAAGHYGGSLTHGSDYLTQHMPPTLRKVAGLPPPPVRVVSKPITNVQEAVVYADIIHPILESRCVNCHNANKQKGNLRMDNPEELIKGGKHGKVFVSGDPAKSKLFQSLLLPEEDEQHMPPKGKTPLTGEQIALIHWWIETGASFDKKVGQVQASPDAQKALAGLGAAQTEPGAPTGVLAQKVPAADPKAVAQLQKLGFQTAPIAQDNHFLQARFTRSSDTLNAKRLQGLLPLAKQITWLDLSNVGQIDGNLKGLEKLTNLTRLHLERSGITDADLSPVKELTNLEYLNLYGTGITDGGLQHLAALKNLKALYLWETKVSESGIQRLQQQIPRLKIDVGVSPAADSLTASVKAPPAKAGAKKSNP